MQFTKHYKEPTDKYNLIVCSAFLLESGYKNDYIYYNGLKNLIYDTMKYYPKYYLRIYFDKSIINEKDDRCKKWIFLFDKIKRMKHIQLVYYNIPDFRVNDIYHDGLIGAIIRFYPFFDYEENKNINIVWITDIDYFDKFTDYISIINKMEENDISLYSLSSLCYNTTSRFNLFDDDELEKKKYIIMAGSMILRIKLPHRILDNFLDCMKHLDNSECKIIKEFVDNAKNDIYFTNNKNISSLFPYGIDEFLLNKQIYDYLIDHKKKIIIKINKISLNQLLYTWKARTNNFADDKFKDLFKIIFKDFYDENLSTIEIYEKASNSIRNKDNNKINIEKIIDGLLKISNYKEYDLRDRDIKCLKDYHGYDPIEHIVQL